MMTPLTTPHNRLKIYYWSLFILSLGLVAMAALAKAQQSSAPADSAPAGSAQTDYKNKPALKGLFFDRGTFPNPHAHIPAQCYTETSFGTQNPCHVCHTDGVARLKLGNNNPQAGDNPMVGSMQTVYGFGVYDYPYVPNSSINPWENTLRPEVLQRVVGELGEEPEKWDMQTYIREDNWTPALAKRPQSADPSAWDTGRDSPFRLFPSLSPVDLPADNDGFVRTNDSKRAIFDDKSGKLTGWRAINFMPYGIFSPMTGSVSGVYIRLPQAFMKNKQGQFERGIYERNLELLTNNVQDRLKEGQSHYLGAAQDIAIVRGQYPLGTELAHPLHYVDLAEAGTRSKRVKEIRWMYKMHEWHPAEFGNELKEESAPVFANAEQGWIENGTGWILAGWIEDKAGHLRPQTPSELTQCVACHSSNARQNEIGQNGVFTSGTGNTIDSTWALPRKFSGAAGWREMDYLGYEPATGQLSIAEPKNRMANIGEFRLFLDRVVGASLYGDMPASMDEFFAKQIRQKRGYSADWPTLQSALTSKDVMAIKDIQQLRQKLMREFTAKGEYLDKDGRIRSELFLPSTDEALKAAQRYRQVVVSQRYDFGKDVFDETPFTFRYFRTPETAYKHQDGRPYQLGEVITDRPVDERPPSFTYGIGVIDTLIPEEGPESYTDYVPLLK